MLRLILLCLSEAGSADCMANIWRSHEAITTCNLLLFRADTPTGEQRVNPMSLPTLFDLESHHCLSYSLSHWKGKRSINIFFVLKQTSRGHRNVQQWNPSAGISGWPQLQTQLVLCEIAHLCLPECHLGDLFVSEYRKRKPSRVVEKAQVFSVSINSHHLSIVLCRSLWHLRWHQADVSLWISLIQNLLMMVCFHSVSMIIRVDWWHFKDDCEGEKEEMQS